MAKALWLTWRNSKGEVVTEIVTEVAPTDPVYVVGIPIGVSEMLEVPGQMMFEDDEGLFAIPTDSIIKIEEVQ